MDGAQGTPVQVDWSADAYWRTRRLSPAQLLVHDVRLEGWRRDVGPMLEIKEVLSSSFLPQLQARDSLNDLIEFEKLTPHRTDQQQLRSLANEFGWLNCLRSNEAQETVFDDGNKLRWIHIPSKFPEYLQGCLFALSDWEVTHEQAKQNISTLQQLEYCIQQNERFSKHGKYFAPFVQHLSDLDPDRSLEATPMLLSLPFLDWTVQGATPPLRFQIDPREGYQSGQTAHLLRSVLQHFYRLEDTSDRECNQVFTKYKPWTTDRNLDLKMRRWFGHYPTGLNVDELWVLVIDSRHVVSFSSNVSWKSRWPPLQLPSRIAEVSFRGIRNSFFLSEDKPEYNSTTHIVSILSGAVGLMHRSFWTDMSLCLTDRYAGYLGNLQYRLHRAPSTKLVMDLLQVQEELNIIIQITQQQLQVIKTLQAAQTKNHGRGRSQSDTSEHPAQPMATHTLSNPFRATFRQLSSSNLADPISQLIDNLHREYTDLCELRDNSNTLLNRTIQLVNIRLEDHGKSILVFTIVTIIFLPMSFAASFFGMNVTDIRNMEQNQSIFWIVSACLTVGVAGVAIFLAFYGGAMVESFFKWKERRIRRMQADEIANVSSLSSRSRTSSFQNFEVLDQSKEARKFS